MTDDLAPYSERLSAAMERAGNRSGRWLATRLAEERGIDAENARRDVRAYLVGETEPKLERAQLLAVILGAPELAHVRTLKERQAVRRSELEARVADLEAVAEQMSPYIVELADRVDALERQVSPSRQGSENGSL